MDLGLAIKSCVSFPQWPRASIFQDMADPRVRTLKIKTGIVKRLTKEKISYEVESEQQRKRIERMRSEGTLKYAIILCSS